MAAASPAVTVLGAPIGGSRATATTSRCHQPKPDIRRGTRAALPQLDACSVARSLGQPGHGNPAALMTAQAVHPEDHPGGSSVPGLAALSRISKCAELLRYAADGCHAQAMVLVPSWPAESRRRQEDR